MELAKNYLRREVKKTDPATIQKIVTSTGFFTDEEIEIAVSLADEYLYKGIESGYQFIFIERNKQTLGYSCYGKVPGTKTSYALYWIAVDSKFRNQGLGKILLKETENDIFDQGGTGIYVETSSRELYIPTRTFYEKNDYLLKTRFEDYYDVGDDLVFYVKYKQ
ncbi:MAG: GNAT family N-acetyltransferase [Bacteroidales bacterium]|nr:GNAT family N-acetyltransferase [Bacteroidales bacterium]